jgi:hypothetical protein
VLPPRRLAEGILNSATGVFTLLPVRQSLSFRPFDAMWCDTGDVVKYSVADVPVGN